MRKVTKMGAAWSSPHRQGVNRSVHGAPRLRMNYSFFVWFLCFCCSRFAAAKVFRMHLRPAFPRISRAPRGCKVEEGPLAAASPQTPWLGGNRLRASLGNLLV